MSQMNFFNKLEGERIVCWFSCGATSAVACKLAILENNKQRDIVIAYCDVGSEHPDNKRFLSDCEKWFGHKITKLKNPKYNNVNEVFEKTRYLNGVNGAKCTQLLKIKMRQQFQRAETDIQVFGFDVSEIDRAADFTQHHPEVNLCTPLIKRGLSKSDCLALIRDAGIEMPWMYRNGYRNNNCIGCVKGGKGYWNKIRIDFPEVFNRRAKQERIIGRSCINGTFLDELDPKAGRYKAEPDISCEGVCVQAKIEIENCDT